MRCMWIGWGCPKNDQTDAFLSWNDNGFPSMHLLRLHGLPSRVQCGNNLTMSEYQDTVSYTYIIEFFQAWGAKARDCTLAKRWDFRVRCVVATCGQRGMVGHGLLFRRAVNVGKTGRPQILCEGGSRWFQLTLLEQLHMSRGNPGHVSSQSSNTVLSQGCWSISSDFSVDSKILNEKAMTLAQPKWLRLMNVYWRTNALCIFASLLRESPKTHIWAFKVSGTDALWDCPVNITCAVKESVALRRSAGSRWTHKFRKS